MLKTDEQPSRKKRKVNHSRKTMVTRKTYHCQVRAIREPKLESVTSSFSSSASTPPSNSPSPPPPPPPPPPLPLPPSPPSLLYLLAQYCMARIHSKRSTMSQPMKRFNVHREWSNTSDFDRQYKLLRLSTYILIANNNGQVVVKIRKEKGHSNNSHHMLFLR